MRTTEEKLTRMHRRAAEIRRKEDRSRLRVWGTLSGGLMFCLVVAVHRLGSMHHEMLTGQSTGSSLLDDSAGGYVLAAVIAFVAGVIITAAIYRNRNRSQHADQHAGDKQ